MKKLFFRANEFAHNQLYVHSDSIVRSSSERKTAEHCHNITVSSSHIDVRKSSDAGRKWTVETVTVADAIAITVTTYSDPETKTTMPRKSIMRMTITSIIIHRKSNDRFEQIELNNHGSLWHQNEIK